MSVLLLFVLLWIGCAVVSSSSSLILHFTNNDTLEIEALYTVIGNPFERVTEVNISIINKEDLEGGGCAPLQKIRARVENQFLIYNGDIFDPKLFHKCILNDFPLALLFTKWAQDAGAVGCLNVASFHEKKFEHGKMAGMSNEVKIPYMITSKANNNKNIKIIADNFDRISYVQLPAVDQADLALFKHLKKAYISLRTCNIVLYSILTSLLLFISVMEGKSLIIHRKINLHRASITLNCFTASLLTLVWMAAGEPNSFDLDPSFPSFPLYILALATCVCTFLLLLKIWIKATGESNVNWKVNTFLYFVHIWAAVLIIVSIFTAAFWYEDGFRICYYVMIYGGAFVGLAGLLYFGKNIVRTLRNSGVANTKSGQILANKIAFCCIMYMVFGIVGISIMLDNTLGGFIGTQVVSIFLCMALFFTFLLLFFKQRSRGGKVNSTSSDQKNSSSS